MHAGSGAAKCWFEPIGAYWPSKATIIDLTFSANLPHLAAQNTALKRSAVELPNTIIQAGSLPFGSLSSIPGKSHLIMQGSWERATAIERVNRTGQTLPSCIIWGALIMKAGFKTRIYHLNGELKSVEMDGRQMR